MRYRLRTLLIVLALMPPVLAWAWQHWPRKEPSFDDLITMIQATIRPDSWDDVGGPGMIDMFETKGCFVIVTDSEDEPVGPDPCGRSVSFRPYSPDEDDGFALIPITEKTISTSSTDDPFASPR